MKSRAGPHFNRSFSNGSQGHNSSMLVHQSTINEKPSFSSLFTANGTSNNNIHTSSNLEHFSGDSSGNDDDGVYLQISNLDQWYDETNLRNYLMSQLKPITPILSLNIETPSIAKVKVPSAQVKNKSKLAMLDFHCLFI